jgi:hypothetical protein
VAAEKGLSEKQVDSTERQNTFFTTAVAGRHHEIFFSSNTPKALRLHLRDVADDEWVTVSISYNGMPNRIDAYVDGTQVPAVQRSSHVNETKPSGTTFMQQSTTTLTVLVKGSKPVDLTVAPVLTLNVEMPVTFVEEDFFTEKEGDFFSTGYDGLVTSLALLFNIDKSRIRVVPAQTAVVATESRRLTEQSNATSSLFSVDRRATARNHFSS